MSAQGDIERRVVGALAQAMPEVDLLELSVLPAQGTLSLVVDHPDGVDHGVCADVTGSSTTPGSSTPMGPRSGPRARAAAPHAGALPAGRGPAGEGAGGGRRWRRRSFTGTLVEADDRSLRLSLGDAEVEIPLSEVRRARALETTEAAG